MFRKKMLRRIIILLFWLLVWLLLALWVDNPVLLVTPQAAIRRILELLCQSSFLYTVGNSLLRIGMGFLLGFLTAVGLAGLSYRYRLAEELLKPVINLMKTVPVASFVVLLLIWWGSETLAVAICFLVVFPNIYINTLEGLKATDRRLLEMAAVFGMSSQNRFLYIYRPALRPFLESSMKISLGMCWKSGVAAELIGTPEFSIGGQLYLAKIHLDTSGVLAWTAVVIVLSMCFEKGILWLLNRFLTWKPVEGKKRKLNQSTVENRKDTSIVLSQVCKAYGEEKVLQNLSVTYKNGETYYLRSPSGSGKTTLLRLLCRLEVPDSGSIEGMGSCSMVFQEDRLCEDYTAVENVMMVTGDRDGAESALRMLLDGDALAKPCGQLSGGMKRRVALVRAMEAQSDIVLLDEPFTGMDAEVKQRTEAYIRERQNGRIMIIATHI